PRGTRTRVRVRLHVPRYVGCRYTEKTMVLTKPELISSLQHEVNILLHLASKIDRKQLDYRPSAKQRSTLELLRYLTVMGPAIVKASKSGRFDPAAWTTALAEAETRDFDQTVAALGTQKALYADLIGSIPDVAFREEIEMFGRTASRGAILVNIVLCG